MVSVIVAIANNNIIGNDNQLLWHITEDMKYFRSVTSQHAVIMGRKTYESIGRPLPKRHNIVITRQNIEIEGCSVVHSLAEALEIAQPRCEIFIIGGAEIYALALPLADKLYVTHIEATYSGDTRFPDWDKEQWSLQKEERFARGEEFPHPFRFAVYQRL